MGQQYATVIREARKFQFFKGDVHVEMIKLRANGRELISPKECIEQRLYGLPEDKKMLRNNPVDSYCAFVPSKVGDEIKLVQKDSLIYQIVGGLNMFGASPITQEHYDQQQGLKLTKEEVRAFWADCYTLPATRRKVWEFLAEGDVKLVQAYEQDVCQNMGLSFDYVMGIHLPHSKGLRLLRIGSVCRRENQFLHDRESNVFGGDSATFSIFGYLASVVPEMQDLREKSDLEARTV
ncbi:hypothetical protein HZB00_04080 [Candidatus Woesearchaeota archaeon]|nr:hypothetical protein [Candidatus Woesearchaeota archaeon]